MTSAAGVRVLLQRAQFRHRTGKRWAEPEKSSLPVNLLPA